MSVPEGRFLHQLQLTVRWADMDALGHVNNIVYFQYFECARLSWYESLGFAPLASSDQGLVIVDNHAQYLKPVIYPAQIVVRMGGHSPGRSSFVSTYTLSVDEQVYTTGSAKIVWIDTRTGKSIEIPESIRRLIS
ncbi:MAG: acyl-CoA thioesterase [Granulosicoccus sp.]|nr:acyl-CoA thioesterase [Granulosicoccus sp.]